jgi:PTS system galactitol-specific IIA component
VFAPELCAAHLPARTADDVVRALSSRLLVAGHVAATFEAAALKREKRSPTGLPFPGTAVALPHADPEHVVKPGIAVATLAAPVTFRQMGSPAVKLDVRIIVMPAFTAKEQAAAQLARVLEMLQDAALRDDLLLATDAAALCAAVAPRWT